jgi:hypothetical protein
MKKQISIIVIMLCTLVINVKAVTIKNKAENGNPTTECTCCKNCKDEKCIALCKKWASMSPEARKGEAGQQVKNECMAICKEKKCCAADGKTASCEAMMEGKDCCKKK